MSKKTEKALNEKLNVKLPENLLKDNILKQLDCVQQNEKIVEIPKKKNTAKKLIPIAASLALVVGLLGIYFGAGLAERLKTEETQDTDKTEVMRYQSYDEIYDKFDELRKDYEENNNGNFLVDLFGNSFNYFTDEAVAENMAGDMNSGSMNDGADMLPEASDDEMWGENTATSGKPSTDTTQNKEFGTTNTQEEGVDEGDIIKTDGNYLYIVNAGGKTVSVVDVQSGEMEIVSQLDVGADEQVLEIYIADNRLVVMGNLYKDCESDGGSICSVDGVVVYKTYGIYSERGNYTFVKVYDITDRAAPKLVTEYSQQGEYGNSRMIGTKLYCISTYYVDITADDYRDKCIPETEVNGVCEKITAECISVVEESRSVIYAVITTLDVENGTEPTSEAILGNCDELYASAKGLFISETSYDNKTYEEFTKIYRFEYTAIGVNYMCMGRVDGYINDQFSMSYDGEHFRIATTVNKTEVFDTDGNSSTADDTAISMSVDDRVNNLYILNNNMQIVGKVEDLAKGETIQSVRFVGNMAYVVTFRQTDPLFVIDLSDPTNPTVKGELKIPGFSEYLHPIADGLLVGVGQDGTESGTNGDCKVSLFDVSNPYEPKETSVLRVTNGNGYCRTPVSSNHKAYVTLANNEFAVPFCCYNSNYYIRYKLENNELYEIARYDIDGHLISTIMGATYVENVFYVVMSDYKGGYCNYDTHIVAYDLETNGEIGRILLDDLA